VNILIDQKQIQNRVKELGQKINEDFKNQEVHLLCVLRGGFIFCADLMREITIPVEVSFVTLSSYGDSKESSGTVKLKSQIPEEIKGKNVIVVEDIVDTGLTLYVLLELLKNEFELKSCKLASLLIKPSKVLHPVEVDYLGFSIDNHFVVGYGLDNAQKLRNLPYIGYFS